MKYRKTPWMGVALCASLAAAGVLRAADAPKPDGGGLFPNDFGPKSIDVSKYPKEMQEGYKLFAAKCTACHTIARPINTQFLELSADEIAEARKETPGMFADKAVLQPEDGLWKRYVKRMMSKPGCPVGKDGKRIYEFLVYDSKARKTGPNWPAWRARRMKLLEDFRREHPAEYTRLFAKSD